MNVIGVAAIVSLIPLLYIAPVLYPGADLLQAFTFALIAAIFLGIAYALIAIAMPRSGSDYVFISRTIHPALGLSDSGLWWFINAIGIGQFQIFTVVFFLSPFLASLGAVYNNATLVGLATAVAQPLTTFVLVVVIIAVSTTVDIVGMKLYARYQMILFVISMVGTILMIGLLASSSLASFKSSFDLYAAQYGTSYQGIIEKAKILGYVPPPYSLASTLLATVFLFEFLTTVWPIIIAGEFRSINKSMMMGNVGGVIFSYALYAIPAILYFSVFGKDFTNALSFLSNSNPSAYPLPSTPYLGYLIGILTTNPLLVGIIGLSFVTWGLALNPNHILICSRYMFAWSFDRVSPEKFASVNPKTHTPVFAILLNAIVGVAVAAFTLSPYGGIYGVTVNVAIMITVYYSIGMVAAIVFPYVKRDLFESAPAIVRKKIGGVPIMSLSGAIALVTMIVATGVYAERPDLSGPVSVQSVTFILAVLVLFGVLYYIYRAYHLRKTGIDISIAFKEIPPT